MKEGQKVHEGYPEGEIHDEYFFAEDGIEFLFHVWKEYPDNILDHDDPKDFQKHQHNKRRTSWFSAIIGNVDIMLEDEMITDPKELEEAKILLQRVKERLTEIKRLKGGTPPKSETDRSNDIMMTHEDVVLGDALLELVEPYAVRLDTDRSGPQFKKAS